MNVDEVVSEVAQLVAGLRSTIGIGDLSDRLATLDALRSSAGRLLRRLATEPVAISSECLLRRRMSGDPAS